MGWVIAAIAVDEASRSILVEAPGAGVTTAVARLPLVELPPGEPTAEQVVAAIEGLLGRPIVPLWLHYGESEGGSEDGVGAVLTIADPARDAGAGRVLVRADGLTDTLEPELARAPIRAWLDRAAGRVDPRTPPWLDPEWHSRVSSWMTERMTAAGLPPTEPPRLSYQSPIGTVLRARSDERAAFLKCPASHFRFEASITKALATRTPGWVPDVMDIEPTEGWLLMADLGDHQLGRDPESTWAPGLRRLGEIQRAWVGHLDELVAAGGQRRPSSALADGLPGMLEVDRIADRLAQDVLERWSANLSRLRGACHELEDIGLPDALVHGDAHPWNIAVTERGPVVFDWSDGAAGPSFVDLAVFLRRTKDLALRRALRDAYLEPWSDVAPRERLERAAELAMTVGALYQVVTYGALLPALPPEDRLAYAGADVGWVGFALDGLERGLDAPALEI